MALNIETYGSIFGTCMYLMCCPIATAPPTGTCGESANKVICPVRPSARSKLTVDTSFKLTVTAFDLSCSKFLLSRLWLDEVLLQG